MTSPTLGNTTDFQERLDRRRQDRMKRVDALSPDVRELVHEYGFTVVDAFLSLKITKARHIRHLVETVLNEFSPTRGAGSKQGTTRAPGVDA